MRLSFFFFLTVSTICLAKPIVQTGWPTTTGDYRGQHYSSLSQINPQNVTQLKQAWVYHTGDVSTKVKTGSPTTFEATPILFEKNLVFCTPFNRVIALNPKTGKKTWSFDPNLNLHNTYSEGYMICRGVASWKNKDASTASGSRIFTTTEDGRLIALNAHTGKPCLDFGDNGVVSINKGPDGAPLIRYRGAFYEGVAYTSAPAVIGDKVIIGMSIGDNFYQNITDGLVRAYSVKSGKLLWTFDPIPKNMRNHTGAANTWAPITVSPHENRIYIATTSPSTDFYGANRLQPIPYSDAVVALNANTGKPIWHYQIVHHNLFDYDLPAQPTLVNIKKGGKTIPAIVQATKMGFIFVLNRKTGKPIYPVTEQPVPASTIPGEKASVTQPFPPKAFRLLNDRTLSAKNAWGITPIDRWFCRAQLKKLRAEGMFTPISTQGSVLFPFEGGGVNWGGVAINPNNNILIVNNSAIAQEVRLVPDQLFNKQMQNKLKDFTQVKSTGTPYYFLHKEILSPLGVPCNAPPWGNLTAINLNTGKRIWQIPFGSVRKYKFFTTPSKWGAPNTGGALVTASGLVFIGASPDGYFHVYNQSTGKLLFKTRLPAHGSAIPMSYQVDGKQYIVIAAGGDMGTPTSLLGDALVAYTLK